MTNIYIYKIYTYTSTYRVCWFYVQIKNKERKKEKNIITINYKRFHINHTKTYKKCSYFYWYMYMYVFVSEFTGKLKVEVIYIDLY